MPETENNNQNGRYTYNAFTIPSASSAQVSFGRSAGVTDGNKDWIKYQMQSPAINGPTKDTGVYSNMDTSTYTLKDSSFGRDAKNYLSQWYSHPVTQEIIQKINKETGVGTDHFTKESTYMDQNGNMQKYTPSIKEGMAYRTWLAANTPQYESHKDHFETESGRRNQILGFFKHGPSLDAHPYTKDNRYAGKHIVYNNGYNDNKLVPFHELNHAYQSELFPKFGVNDHNKTHDNKEIEQQDYLLSLRAGLNLDPGKRDYTKEDAQEIINAVDAAKEKHVGRGGDGDYFDENDYGARLIKAIGGNASTLQNMLNTWPAFQDPAKAKRDLQLGYKLGGKLKSWFK